MDPMQMRMWFLCFVVDDALLYFYSLDISLSITFFSGAFPLCICFLLCPRYSQCIGWCITSQCSSGPNGRPCSHSHRRHQLRIRTNKCVVLDDGQMLVSTIIIAGDSPSTDIDALANMSVAQIAQMTGLGSLAHTCIFNFYKITDTHIRPQLSSWT